MSRKGATNIGWPYEPAGVVAAQMNGYYTAAVKLLDGEVFIEQFHGDRLADPRILALIPRIAILHDPVLDEGGAAKRHAVKVEARLCDGRTLSCAIEQRRGSFQKPLTEAELEAKFSRLAGSALAEPAVQEIREIVHDLEAQPHLGRLIELLSIGAARSEEMPEASNV
jgi:2-methylcitrate dehydratase PrpD